MKSSPPVAVWTYLQPIGTKCVTTSRTLFVNRCMHELQTIPKKVKTRNHQYVRIMSIACVCFCPTSLVAQPATWLLALPKPSTHHVQYMPLLPPQVLPDQVFEPPRGGAQSLRHGPLDRLRSQHLVPGTILFLGVAFRQGARGAGARVRRGGGVLMSCMAVVVRLQTLALLRCRDAARRVFTHQADIARNEREAP